MVSDKEIHEQLPYVLERTDFPAFGERYEGKVRDSYVRGDKRVLIVTDRLSCFDVVVTSIPFKGQVLNQLAAHWFGLSGDIIDNHLIEVPDPNVMIVRNCKIVPLEIVVRGYLAGSALRDYQAGNAVSGVRLPPGLVPYGKLPEVLLTPSTKEAKGKHDEPISEQEIVSRGVLSAVRLAELKETALALFALGQREAEKRGLILVDTKYEFGLIGERLILADEIHTLDSSRYWVRDSYAAALSRGDAPVMLDKEPTRQWLLSRGYKGDGEIPHFTDEHRVQIARHYIDAFEKISGRQFLGSVGSVRDRIAAALA